MEINEHVLEHILTGEFLTPAFRQLSSLPTSLFFRLINVLPKALFSLVLKVIVFTLLQFSVSVDMG